MVDEENGNQSRYQMLRQAEPTKSEPNVHHDETGQFMLSTEIRQEKNAQDNPQNGSDEVENEKREQADVGVLDALELAFSFEEGFSEGATFCGLGIEGVDVNEQTHNHGAEQKRTCDVWSQCKFLDVNAGERVLAPEGLLQEQLWLYLMH
ncbi:hypothetical protein WMY93_015105 [Mugilogobius chulae]|uniref:Uncharacterized protein n=1 Tax=Mugilogobius chulae TaxID=88201 RepID=A0AAW0P670_9GOBI